MERFKLNLNAKNINIVLDYCIAERVEFSSTPEKEDEWLFEIVISTIRKAINFGMFLKENRINLLDDSVVVNAKPVAKNSKKEHKENIVSENKEKNIEKREVIEPEGIFSFVPGNKD